MEKDWKTLFKYGLLSLFGITLLAFIWLELSRSDSAKSLPEAEPKPAKSDTIPDIYYYAESLKALIPDSAGRVTLIYSKNPDDTIVHVLVDSVRLLQLTEDWNDTKFPEAVFAFKNLRFLGLGMRGFKTMPPGISQLGHLEEIDFQHGSIEKLPDDFCQLRNLRRAVFLFSNLKELPKCIGDLEHLEFLHLGFTHVKRFPESMKNLKKLKHVIIRQDPDKPHISEPEYLKLISWLPGCEIRYDISVVR